MSLNNIRELVSKRIEELKKPYEPDERVKYLEENFSSYNVVSPKDIPEDYLEQIITAILIMNTDLDLKEIKYRANKFYKFITEPTKNSNEMDQVTITLIDLMMDKKQKDKETYKRFLTYFKGKGIFGGLGSQMMVRRDVPIEEVQFIDALKITCIRSQKMEELMIVLDLIENEEKAITEIANFYYALKNYQNLQYDIFYLIAMTDKKFRKSMSKSEKDVEVKRLYNKIPEFIRNAQGQEKQYNKSTATEIVRLQSGIRKLEKLEKQDEITEVDEILGYFTTIEMKKAVLWHIYEKNMIYHQKLVDEYNTYEQNKTTRIRYILKKNDIEVTEEAFKDIMNLSIQDVSNIIALLKDKKFDANTIREILRISDIETVKRIYEYIDKGFLTTRFIYNNLSICKRDSEELRSYEESVSFLNDLNINPSIFSDVADLLVGNNQLFINSIKTLINYDLLGSIRTTDNHSFLKDENLSGRIDRFLEDGLEESLLNDLNILNSDNIKRIELLNALNFGESLSEDEINKALFGKSFIVSDKEIDDFIPTTPTDEVELTITREDLNDYTYTPRTYKIGNSLFSINKVNRLLKNNSISNALFKDKTISSEDRDIVIKELKGKEKAKN